MCKPRLTPSRVRWASTSREAAVPGGGEGVGGELPGAQLLSTATPAGRLREQREQRAAAAERAAAVITADALSDARKAELLARLTPLSGSIDGMQKMAAGAAFYLPPFDIRSAATSLRKMRATLASTKELVQPKKKFSFKEKRAARKAAAEAKKAAKKAKKEAERLQRLAAGGDAPSASSGDKKVKVKATQASFLPTVVDYTVRAKRNETITVPPGALSEWAAQELEEKDKEGGAGTGGETSKSRDVVLADLEDCVVFLGDTMSALRVDNLRRCHVYGGPVAGVVIARRVRGLHVLAGLAPDSLAPRCAVHVPPARDEQPDYRRLLGAVVCALQH